jgi:hypothetical protein
MNREEPKIAAFIHFASDAVPSNTLLVRDNRPPNLPITPNMMDEMDYFNDGDGRTALAAAA